MYDYVYFTAPQDYCVELRLVFLCFLERSFRWKAAKKKSNYEYFESDLYSKSGSMALSKTNLPLLHILVSLKKCPFLDFFCFWHCKHCLCSMCLSVRGGDPLNSIILYMSMISTFEYKSPTPHQANPHLYSMLRGTNFSLANTCTCSGCFFLSPWTSFTPPSLVIRVPNPQANIVRGMFTCQSLKHRRISTSLGSRLSFCLFASCF